VRHASLALDAYVQFTSPIRRYSDILAHFNLKVGGAAACVLSLVSWLYEGFVCDCGAGDTVAPCVEAYVQAKAGDIPGWSLMHAAMKFGGSHTSIDVQLCMNHPKIHSKDVYICRCLAMYDRLTYVLILSTTTLSTRSTCSSVLIHI
jgi:hypothetical protein